MSFLELSLHCEDRTGVPEGRKEVEGGDVLIQGARVCMMSEEMETGTFSLGLLQQNVLVGYGDGAKDAG